MVVCLFDPKETSAQFDGACAEARFLAALQEALTTSGGWGAVPSLVGCSGSLPREGAPGSPTGVVVLRRLVAGAGCGRSTLARLSCPTGGRPRKSRTGSICRGHVAHFGCACSESPWCAHGIQGARAHRFRHPECRFRSARTEASSRRGPQNRPARFGGSLRGRRRCPRRAGEDGHQDSGRCFGWLVSELALYKMGLVSSQP